MKTGVIQRGNSVSLMDKDTIVFKNPANKHERFDDFMSRGYSSSFGNRGNGKAKHIALLMVLGDIQEAECGASFWCGRPPSISGFSLSTTSITVKPYISVYYEHSFMNGNTLERWRTERPLLYALLDMFGIGFSGGAGESPHSYAQASWSKEDAKHSVTPMELVCTFLTMKRCYAQGKLELDYL